MADKSKESELIRSLEPRILFDGAVGETHAEVAAQQIAQDQVGQIIPPVQPADSPDSLDPPHIDSLPVDARSALMAAGNDGLQAIASALSDHSVSPQSGPQFVFVDTSVRDYQTLLAGINPSAQVVLLDSQKDGVAQIQTALASQQNVEAIYLIGHGAEGEIKLGPSLLNSETIGHQYANAFKSIGQSLAADADILVYGCDFAAGEDGLKAVNELASLTGANVAASNDDTGAAGQGGDWDLEVHTGTIDSDGLLNPQALANYPYLLDLPAPEVSLSGPSQTSIGGDFTFTATFKNTAATGVGYAPYITLLLPATGVDGNDGIHFVSASYLGQAVTAYTVTFDSAGQANHPLAVDSSGQHIRISASSYGFKAGDSLVVLQLPFGSVAPGQPDIPIAVTANLSQLADVADDNSKNLTLSAFAGFQLGTDAQNNPSTDPSIDSSVVHTMTVHPTLLGMTQGFDGQEQETATGPNYIRHVTNTVSIANGQAINNFEVSQQLPGNIVVTGITPDVGGSIKSITLRDGTVINEANRIASTLASGSFLQSYTVRYGTITAAKQTSVGFYVPKLDYFGHDVIDPSTGAPTQVTIPAAIGSGSFSAQENPGISSPISSSGIDTVFTAKAITIQGSVSVQTDTQAAGMTPGDTLQHDLRIDISDYFGFGANASHNGHWLVTSELSDGQTVNPGFVPTLVYTDSTGEHSIVLVRGSSYFVGNAPGDDSGNKDSTGKTYVTFDLVQVLAHLSGDLHVDNVLDRASQVHISLRSIVDNSYTTVYAQSLLNEGDSVSSTSTTDATLLDASLNLTGNTDADVTASSATIEASSVVTHIIGYNGQSGVPASVKAGDTLTLELTYHLATGNYEDFSLQSFLPLPVLQTVDPNVDGSYSLWSAYTGAGLPGVGQWRLGSSDSVGAMPVVTADGVSNSLAFYFGSNTVASATPRTISVQFTLKVSDQPFADDLFLTLLSQSSQKDTLSTVPGTEVSKAVVNVNLAEPVVQIHTGTVGVSNHDATITGRSGTWLPTTDTSASPFVGTINSSLAVAGDLRNFDAGDTLRLATAVQNTGGSGAFGVTVTIGQLPTGLNFVGGSLATANLKVVKGDGQLLLEFRDYSLSGNTITLLDWDGEATLGAGHNGSQRTVDGSQVVVITYDTVASESLAAATTLHTTASLGRYTNTLEGTDFLADDVQATATDVSASPTVSVAPSASLQLFNSSDPGTGGTDLVIGESGLYAIKVTLPEGESNHLNLAEIIPAGMMIDTSYGISGFKVFSTRAGANAEALGLGGLLAADFNGAAINFTINGTQIQINNGADFKSTSPADNNTNNNSFLVAVKLIAIDANSNHAGDVKANATVLTWDNGTNPNSRGNASAVINSTIREPSLTITQVVDTDLDAAGIQTTPIDAGNTVQYRITISNPPGGNRVNAYDLLFKESFASQLSSLSIVSAEQGGTGFSLGSGIDVSGLFEVSGQSIQSLGGLAGHAGVNLDLLPGESIVLVGNAVANAGIASVTEASSIAEVRWSSLDSPDNLPISQDGHERTGVDGLGSGLDNYAAQASVQVQVISAAPSLSHVGGLLDTDAASPTTGAEQVAVGEIIRYRAVIQVPEGTLNNLNLRAALPAGLSFLHDNSTKIVFLSNTGGIVSSIGNLTSGGELNSIGNGQSLLAGNILANFANGPSAILDASLIDIANPQAPVFNLGTISNSDNDADGEYIVIEFNARVDNIAAVTTDSHFDVSITTNSGGTVLGTSNTVTEEVVEPEIINLSKVITEFNPSSKLATVTVSFSNTGDGMANQVHLADGLAGGRTYSLVGITIGGRFYSADTLPDGVSISTQDGIVADFAQIAPGTSVILVYSVDVQDNYRLPASNAQLSYAGLPSAFSSFAGSVVGAEGSITGARDGSGGGQPPNHYHSVTNARFGYLAGTVWDDTFYYNDHLDAGEGHLSGQTVTLVWAGEDGDFASSEDNLSFTTVTDAHGNYHFNALPAGVYRIIGANNGGLIHDDVLGMLLPSAGNAFIDSVRIGDGVTIADFGYVQVNDAPVNHVPDPQSMLEDGVLAISTLSVSDDAGTAKISVQLSVFHGLLDLPLVGGVAVSAGALHSPTLTLCGTVADINASLAGLKYTSLANYQGSETLTIVSNDRGQTGVANGFPIPNRPEDTLITTSTLSIMVQAVNDAPLGADKTVSINEDSPYLFTVSDFSFSDANDSPGDAFAGIIITRLPASSEGLLTLDGVAVRAGQLLTVAQISHLQFLPAANINGSSVGAFAFQVVDDGGQANGGQNADPQAKTFAFTIAPVNDAPVGASTTITIAEDGSYTFGSTDFGFTDPSDQPGNGFAGIIITLLPASGEGSLSLNGVTVNVGQFISAGQISQLIFLPALDINGANISAFSFQVVDDGGAADTEPKTINFVVTAVNDAPTGASKTIKINEDSNYNFSPSDFGFSDGHDQPANQFAGVTISQLPTSDQGSLILDGVAVSTGQFIAVEQFSQLWFVPAANVNGSYIGAFSFQVVDDGGNNQDGQNTDPQAKTIAFDVASVNDAPVGISKGLTIAGGADAYHFKVGDFGFSDPNDNPANAFAGIIVTDVPTSQGSLALNGKPVIPGQFVPVGQLKDLVFIPASGVNGKTVSYFLYQVVDDGGLASGQNTQQTASRFVLAVVSVRNVLDDTGQDIIMDGFIEKPSSAEELVFNGLYDYTAGIFTEAVMLSLPSPNEGILSLAGQPVSIGQTIPSQQISNLQYEHADQSQHTAISFHLLPGNAAENYPAPEQSANNAAAAVDAEPSNDALGDTASLVLAAEDIALLGGAAMGVGSASMAAPAGGLGGGGGSGVSTLLMASGAGAFLQRLRAFSIPVLLTGLLLFVLMFNHIVVTIDSGEAGVLYRRFSGTETDTVYGEGLHLIYPWDIMHVYEVRKQVQLHEFDVISNKGLTIHLLLAIRYQPEYDLLGVLHQKIGPDYLQRVILPQIESVIRKSLGRYSAEQIYTNEAGLLTHAILAALEEVGRNFVKVEDIIIRDIQLPPEMVSAIENKLKQEEHMKSYEFRIQTATKEAERLKIEAEGIKRYDSAINETLTESVLQYKGIEATQKLGASENAKVVVIGSGSDGLPIILGGDQAAPAPLAAEPANTITDKK